MGYPKNWNEVTLEMAIKAERYQSELPEELKSLSIIAAYGNISVEQVKSMPFTDIPGIFNQMKFITEPLPNAPIGEFEYKGEKYYCTETLLKNELQDFWTVQQLAESSKPNENLSKIIAVLCKKEGETLSSFKLEDRAKHFLELPLPIANSVYLFFCLIAKQSTIDLDQTLKNQDHQLRELMNSILNSAKQQVGDRLSIRLQKVILRSWIAFLKYRWNAFYTGFTSGRQKRSLIVKFRSWLKRILMKN